MKLFLDTGNVEEIRKAHELGILDGVTTNPSLIAKGGRDFIEVLKEIIEIFKDHPEASISAEVTSLTAEAMVAEAKPLAKLDRRITIKVPIIPEGIKAIKVLSSAGIKTNATLCFSAAQALLVAKAGATYVSPFLGRLDDIGEDSLKLLKEIRTVFNNYQFKTMILAASIRNLQHVVDCALIGADVATLPFKVFEEMFKHPLTDKGLAKFLEDWEGFSAKGRSASG